MNRHRIGVWAVLAALAVLAGTGLMRQCSTEESVEGLREQIADASHPSFSVVEGVYYVKPLGWEPAAWAAKTRADHDLRKRGLQIEGGQYVCTTLEDCQALDPPGPIQVCTWCEHPQSQQCSQAHAAEVRAFCEEFECDC